MTRIHVRRPTYRTNASSRLLSRHMILGGAGTLLALPFLESLVPRALRQASAGPGDPPLRALFYYVPNGMHMPSWTPARWRTVAPPDWEAVIENGAAWDMAVGLPGRDGGGRA